MIFSFSFPIEPSNTFAKTMFSPCVVWKQTRRYKSSVQCMAEHHKEFAMKITTRVYSKKRVQTSSNQKIKLNNGKILLLLSLSPCKSKLNSMNLAVKENQAVKSWLTITFSLIHVENVSSSTSKYIIDALTKVESKANMQIQRNLLFFCSEEICSKLILNCSQSKDILCLKQIHEEFACQCPSTMCQYGMWPFISPLKIFESIV